MPNSYFSFREFTVRQDRCAMKVCTDACLFGAWLANHVQHTAHALDIGAGTGLLSLMLAQESDALIDAIEIDEDAAGQAKENFNNSSWASRLTVIHKSLQDHASSVPPPPRYDLIFSNPPFFSNDLKSPDSRRNLALHSDALSLEELVHCVKKLLKPGGSSFALVVPWQRGLFLEKLASESGLYMTLKTDVRQTPQHAFFRSMYLFCSVPSANPSTSEIIIRDNNQKYTPEFSEMMKNYYLVPDNALQ